MTTIPEKPPRKFPAPCWTQDETLALIDAYRDRWYALRRGYLRTADWDAVAAAVTGRCPDASPAKTSAQCRHKMEKLRQRYRTEKQRSLSFPGRFFSTWFFFENMDSMGIGSSSVVGSNQASGNRADSGSTRIKILGDGNSNPNVDQEGVDELRLKVDRNSGFRAKNSSPNYGSRVLNGYSPYVDDGSDEDAGDDTDFGGGFHGRTPIDGKLVPPLIRAKKLEKFHGSFGPNFDSNHDEAADEAGGFFLRNPVDQHLVPPVYRAKKFVKVEGKLNPNFVSVDGSYPVPTGFRTKNSGKNTGNSFPNLDPRFLNGFSSNLGMGLGKRRGDGGVKRERDGIAEMVSSIKMLGDGFVKMEKMKMEMAREVEKVRMEMEMKRNELILESQRQIVDAFVAVVMEKKNKKADPTVLPES